MFNKPCIRVIPYRRGSKGAKSIASAVGGKVLKLNGSSFQAKAGDLLINWGNTSFNPGMAARVLNPPNLIRQASNKLLFFGTMREAGHETIIPPFWTRREDIPDDAYPVVCRTVLAGHSGAGIVIAVSPDQLVPASLYVKYISKKDEYRVHVGKTRARVAGLLGEGALEGAPDYEEGERVIAVQRKARRLDTPDTAVNWKVRSHSNGFNFVRGNIDPPTEVLEAARTALLASGLDFAAIDVIWNEKHQRAYVLEANTAPGLEGQTIQDYANYFRSF